VREQTRLILDEELERSLVLLKKLQVRLPLLCGPLPSSATAKVPFVDLLQPLPLFRLPPLLASPRWLALASRLMFDGLGADGEEIHDPDEGARGLLRLGS
jgi:hypothetical protein